MQIKTYLDNWMWNRIIRFAVVSLVFLLACSKENEPVTAPLSGTPEITVTTLLSNQGIIGGFDILPNGNLLFTQKAGTMRLYDTSTQSNTLISGLPSNISASGQGDCWMWLFRMIMLKAKVSM
jgi:hypothetical protein